MADGVVGVKQSADADRLIDNGVHVVDGQTVYRQRIEDPKTVGTPGYASGTGGGTVNVPTGARLLGFSFKAEGADATVTVAAGPSILIRDGDSFSWPGRGNYIAPQIVFSASANYFVEWVL